MSILGGELEGARVLDLFAGSGALGLEMLSRGAAHADFVELSPASLAALRQNIEALGAGAESTVHRGDAIRFAERLIAERPARLVILGDSGPKVGQDMTGGSIYVAGNLAELGTDAMLIDLPREELDDLLSFLERYRIPFKGTFQKIVNAGKKLRYVADFFRSLYPKKPTSKFIAALAEVQDQLGSLNDAVVSRQLLLALEGRIANANDIEAARHASGLVLGWQAARIDRDLAGFQTTWRKLRQRPPFWSDDVR